MKRRGFLKFGIGAVTIGGLVYWQRNALARLALTNMSNGVTASVAPQVGSDVCLLTPEQTSGPYFVKSPLRSNITEERPGLPLKLAIEIVRLPDCTALQGLTVEIWHCDAAGYYSGYSQATVRKPFDTLVDVISNSQDGHIPPVDDEMFMRGGQVTDDRGMVEFESVFPGWYDPRLTHIHVKVSRDDKAFLTTQLYFPDEMVRDIYANHPDYAPHGNCPYNLQNDSVLRELSENTAVILNAERSQDQISATVRFGIA